MDRVYLDYHRPTARPLDRLTVAEARAYLAEGQFPEGSMAPKIRAIVRFLERGGRRGVVCCPEEIARAVEGLAGTQLVP